MPRKRKPGTYRDPLPKGLRSELGLSWNGMTQIGDKLCPNCGCDACWPDPNKCRVCEHRKRQEAFAASDDPEARELREAAANHAKAVATLERLRLETKRA